MGKNKKIAVEFYILLSDHTWDTTIIDIPEHLVFEYNENNLPKNIIEWAEKHEKFDDSVWLIGIYSIG